MRSFLGTDVYIWLLFLFIALISLQNYDFALNGSGIFYILLILEILLLNFFTHLNTTFKNTIKKLFFSNFGFYFFQFGLVFILYIIVSTVLYEPGFFDFRYWGIKEMSYPLAAIIKINFDKEKWLSIFQLFGIFIANAIFIIYIADLIYYISARLFKKIIN